MDIKFHQTDSFTKLLKQVGLKPKRLSKKTQCYLEVNFDVSKCDIEKFSDIALEEYYWLMNMYPTYQFTPPRSSNKNTHGFKCKAQTAKKERLPRIYLATFGFDYEQFTTTKQPVQMLFELYNLTNDQVVSEYKKLLETYLNCLQDKLSEHSISIDNITAKFSSDLDFWT